MPSSPSAIGVRVGHVVRFTSGSAAAIASSSSATGTVPSSLSAIVSVSAVSSVARRLGQKFFILFSGWLGAVVTFRHRVGAGGLFRCLHFRRGRNFLFLGGGRGAVVAHPPLCRCRPCPPLPPPRWATTSSSSVAGAVNVFDFRHDISAGSCPLPPAQPQQLASPLSCVMRSTIVDRGHRVGASAASSVASRLWSQPLTSCSSMAGSVTSSRLRHRCRRLAASSVPPASARRSHCFVLFVGRRGAVVAPRYRPRVRHVVRYRWLGRNFLILLGSGLRTITGRGGRRRFRWRRP